LQISSVRHAEPKLKEKLPDTRKKERSPSPARSKSAASSVSGTTTTGKESDEESEPDANPTKVSPVYHGNF